MRSYQQTILNTGECDVYSVLECTRFLNAFCIPHYPLRMMQSLSHYTTYQTRKAIAVLSLQIFGLKKY